MIHRNLVAGLWALVCVGTVSIDVTHAAAPSLEIESVSWGDRRTGSYCFPLRLKVRPLPKRDRPGILRYQVRRDGLVVHDSAFREFDNGTIELELRDLGHPFEGSSHTIELRSVNNYGEVSPWTEPRLIRRPTCSGAPANGRTPMAHTYALVTFADFADRLPFTLEEFRNESLSSINLSDQRISMNDYLSLVSYGQADVRDTFIDWVVLPGTTTDYCSVVDQDGWGLACDRKQVLADALTELRNTYPIESKLNFIINGASAIGFANPGGAGATWNSARALLPQPVNHPNELRFDSLAHELFHAYGLNHAASMDKCAAGPIPHHMSASIENSRCDRTRYGASIMGGASLYAGLSGWQRILLGWLDDDRMTQASLTTQNQIEVFDLDEAQKLGPQFVRFPLEEERNVLPTGQRLFLEYSKEDHPLQFYSGSNENRAQHGLRVGLYYWKAEATGVNENLAINGQPRKGEGHVLYFPSVRLQKVGDRVALESLKIAISVIAVKDKSIVVNIEPLQITCRDYPLQIDYKIYRRLTPYRPRVIESRSVKSFDFRCPRRRLRWRSTLDERYNIEERSLSLISGEQFELEDLHNPTWAVSSELLIQEEGQPDRTLSAGIDDPDAFSVDFSLQDGKKLAPNQTVRLKLTNDRNSPALYTIEDPGRDDDTITLIPGEYLVQPGETKTVEVARVSSNPTSVVAVSISPPDLELDILLNGSPHTKVTMGLKIYAATCSDGFQNGGETGVDCGGSRCDPCPEP